MPGRTCAVEGVSGVRGVPRPRCCIVWTFLMISLSCFTTSCFTISSTFIAFLSFFIFLTVFFKSAPACSRSEDELPGERLPVPPPSISSSLQVFLALFFRPGCPVKYIIFVVELTSEGGCFYDKLQIWWLSSVVNRFVSAIRSSRFMACK